MYINIIRICIQSFKAQILADTFTISISTVPIFFYNNSFIQKYIINDPYIPCQDQPQSFFDKIELKKKIKSNNLQKYSLIALTILAGMSLMAFIDGNNDIRNQNNNNNQR